MSNIRIIIWLILIGIGFGSGLVTGRYALPVCDLGTSSTTANKSTEYVVEYGDNGEIKKKIKTVLDKPKIKATKEKKIAPDWGVVVGVEPTKRQNYNLGLQYKLFDNILGTDANLYLQGGVGYDRENDELVPLIGFSLFF